MYYFILDKLTLPVTPSSVNFSYGGQNKSCTLINDGEINFLKDSKLEDISFKFLIPHQSYAFATVKGYTGQKTYINWLENTKKKKKPFQFIIVRFKPNGSILFYSNIKVSLENYSLDESADNGFDVTASIKLKRYRPFGTKIMAVDEKNNTATTKNARDISTSPKPTVATEYKVKSGNSLWKIAKSVYGDGSLYTEIAKANDIKNPNLILIGQRLILPKL